MSSSSTSSITDKLPSAKELEQDVVVAAKKSVSSLRDFAAGGVGGIFAVVVGHPFDLVKVRMQTAEKGVYTGAMDVVRKTVAREGLVRGYGVGKQLVESFSEVKDGQYSVGQVSAAGFFSAIPMTIITAPFERVKIILQIQGQKQLAPGEKPKYSGGMDVVRQLYKQGGIKSVYRGSVMTLARDGPGSAAYFATYETIKRRLTPKDVSGKPQKLSLPAVMAAGGAAGVAMWIPVFPVDTIKSRLQSADGNAGISATIKQLYAKGGLKAFFPGMGPAMARAIPANAATFLGVELAHSAMNKTFG
ncbi:carnitine transporter [Elasticomyces elasticus]|uniref:Carnitine transporter n=1 Tax=Elasticomyces elasticus TaxID=574655 RepID=A0AAN7W9K6_9PEZI|nr:carnitine transporter [Elasticomyces elasticus]